MSNDTVVIPGSIATPEWLKKKLGIFSAMEEQVIRELEFPGTGVKLDDLQSYLQQPRVESPHQRLINGCYRKLRRRLGWIGQIDPLPKTATPENIARWGKFNLRLVFLPDGEISETAPLHRWTKPEKWFYDQIRSGKIAADSATLRRGWYLADFTVGADYTDGRQVFVDDPLSPFITKLREAELLGKYDNTPLGSRFVATNDEWRQKLLPLLTDILSGTGVVFRLERAIESNAIGNTYDKNRGQFNMLEWFDDAFRGGCRLCGGSRVYGGLPTSHF